MIHLHSTWLWNIGRGISGDEVQGRLLPKSHGAGKTFPGPRALKSIAAVCFSDLKITELKDKVLLSFVIIYDI